MLFLNISRESIYLQGKWFSKILEYKDIERTLPKTLQEIIERYDIECIWVLNGPWGFTFLRLGCMVVNMINTLRDVPLKIYECSKLDIYTYAVEQLLVPDMGVVFMGQRKKLWKVKVKSWKLKATSCKQKLEMATTEKNTLLTCPEWNIEILSQENIETFTKENRKYFIDPCEHVLLKHLNINNMLEMSFDGEILSLWWKGDVLDISVDNLGLKSIASLESRYMMDVVGE